MPARLPAASLAAAVAALLCARAHPAAAGEDDRSLSLSGSYATYSIPDHAPAGAALGLEYERGFSDAMSFRVGGGGGIYFASLGEDGKTSYSTHATVGITYLFDVVRYVPYATVGLGGIWIFGGGQDAKLNALVEFGVGLDILQSRRFSWGVQARLESFVQETSFFTAGVRATWRWGFF